MGFARKPWQRTPRAAVRRAPAMTAPCGPVLAHRRRSAQGRDAATALAIWRWRAPWPWDRHDASGSVPAAAGRWPAHALPRVRVVPPRARASLPATRSPSPARQSSPPAAKPTRTRPRRGFSPLRNLQRAPQPLHHPCLNPDEPRAMRGEPVASIGPAFVRKGRGPRACEVLLRSYAAGPATRRYPARIHNDRSQGEPGELWDTFSVAAPNPEAPGRRARKCFPPRRRHGRLGVARGEGLPNFPRVTFLFWVLRKLCPTFGVEDNPSIGETCPPARG
jgi:hypothetical protein